MKDIREYSIDRKIRYSTWQSNKALQKKSGIEFDGEV